MARRIFITGSSDGLGLLAAQRLISQGHTVVLHARNASRAQDALAACPGAETCLIADLSSIAQTKSLAAQANASGKFDSVIHNAGVGYGSKLPSWTEDGFAATFAVNSLAPYILTCLMRPRPERLVYVSSGLHRSGEVTMKVGEVTWRERERGWDAFQAYCDSKLHNVLLANAVARRWGGQGVRSNSVDPLWQPTKMGGKGAPGDLREGVETQCWLAGGEDGEGVGKSGRHWRLMKEVRPLRAAEGEALQDEYLKVCEELSGLRFPEA